MLPGKKYAISDVVGILRRRVLLLVVPPLVTLFGALVYSSTLPNVYQSDVLIAIIPQRVPENFVKPTVTLKTQDRLEAITTQLKSRTILEKLIVDMDLYRAERERLPMEDVVEIMRKNFFIELEEQRRGPEGPLPPHAFHVKFNYTDPVVAQKVTEKLGSAYSDQNTRDRSILAEATDSFLETQLTEARERLEQQERRLEAFRERHGNELPTQVQSNMQAMQSGQMQIQALVEAQARDRDRKMFLERLYADAEREPLVSTQPAPTGPAGGDVTAVAQGSPAQQLAAARENLARLERRLTAEHPDVITAKRVIAELEQRVADDAAKAAQTNTSAGVSTTVSQSEATRRENLRTMKAEIESLDRQAAFKASEEARLRAQLGEYQRRLESVPGIESEWVALTRDYETQQTAYKTLLAKSEDAKVALSLERRQIGEQFRVMDPAGVPTRPISPVRIQISGIGFGIGLMLGLVVAALLEIRDSTYRSESDVFDALSLPVLASVPHVDTVAELARRQKRRLAVAIAAGGITVAAGYVFWTMRLWTQIV